MSPASLTDPVSLIAGLEEWHFWFVARGELIQRLLLGEVSRSGSSVLDIGCGTGLTVSRLSLQGYRVVGTDINVSQLKKRSRLHECGFVQSAATALPFSAASFDCALLLDVLEHVDTVTALQEAKRVLRPSGMLLLTVPAFPWLWSHRDRVAGHRFRFRKESVKSMLARAGFKIQRVHYYQCILFPFLMATRLLGRSSASFSKLEERPGKIINRIATMISRLEVRLTRFFPWPFGSTLVCVARNQE